MLFTNKHNLPEPIYKAILAHEHKGAKYSASGISKSPRAFILTRRHDHEIVKDISDMAWVFFGIMLHSYLEKYGLRGNFLAEQSLETTIAGQPLSGTSDLLCQDEKNYIIHDYKTMSVYGFIFWKDGKFNDYEVQLNTYRFLYHMHDFLASKLMITAFFKDWKKRDSKNEGYPKTPIAQKKVQVWSLNEIKEYIEIKIKTFEKFWNRPEQELPLCLPEELWQTPDTYAVKKNKVKKAVRVLYSKEDAEQHITKLLAHGEKAQYFIEKRCGLVNRCEYCDASPFCSQYSDLFKNGLIRRY